MFGDLSGGIVGECGVLWVHHVRVEEVIRELDGYRVKVSKVDFYTES